MPRLKTAIQTKRSCNAQENRAALVIMTYTYIPHNERAKHAPVLKGHSTLLIAALNILNSILRGKERDMQNYNKMLEAKFQLWPKS